MRTRAAVGACAAGLAVLLAVTGCSTGSAGPAQAGAVGPSSAAATPSETPTPTPTLTPAPTPSGSGSASTSARASKKPSPKPSATSSRTTTGPAGTYTFPLRCTGYSYGHSHHDYPATDIFAPRGCLVVSPVSGVVDEITTVDTWSSTVNSGATRGGLSFSIVGVDGVRYYGSHLESLLPSVRPGVHVTAGQAIGRVGNTGSARGTTTHLHFGISWPTGPGVWWVRRGEVYPWPYLDAWRAGVMSSPGPAVRARHRQVGDVGCTVYC